MIQVEMSAAVRNEFGKGAMRRMRAAGVTPAVVYGAPGSEVQALQVNTKDFYKNLLMIQRRNAVLSITIDSGAVRHVLIQDVQADPVIIDRLEHADFIFSADILKTDLGIIIVHQFGGVESFGCSFW